MSDENDDVVESEEGRYSMTDMLENADDREVKMILGDRQRIRPAGKIRPGIKAPVGTCTPAQKALYEKLFAENVGFDTIDSEMLKLEAKGSTRKSCLRPANCDYFMVNDSDFNRQSDAEYIRKTYADKDGRVRRIPVWFSVSERHRAMPHAFTAFDGGGNLRCVSFYDGDKLKFRYLPKGLQNAKQEDWKILDSNDEDEATKACGLKVSLTGAYHVQIPGIRSVGGVLVNTKSWYGLSDAMAVLREVKRVLGRFDNLFQGQPFFELVKVPQTMKVEGKTTKQWIVTLELSVDMMELARYAEPAAVAARSLQALSAFGGAPLVAVSPSPVVNMPPVVLPEPAPLPAALDVPPAIDDPHAAGIAYLQSLIAPVSLFMADMDNLSASMYAGLVVNDLDIDTLRIFCRRVRDEIASRGAAFTDDMKAMRAA